MYLKFLRVSIIFILNSIFILNFAKSFHLKSAGYRRQYLFMKLPTDVELYQELENKLQNAEYSEAFQVLRKNPMLHVRLEEAKIFLNNIDNIVPISDFQERQRKVILLPINI